MGVLNVTPDSFSDGGELLRGDTPDLSRVIDRCAAMVAQGASVIDIGGESTRPGAAPVGVEQELARVVPAVEALAARFDCVVSVDTSTPEVMRAAVAAGAGLLNDVRSFQRGGALDALADSGAAACVMHMQGEPGRMQDDPQYDDVVNDVGTWLEHRATDLQLAGIARDRILLDPGFGFGKTVQHNLALLKHLDALVGRGYPVLVGLSRKATIGAITGRDVGQRATGSAVMAAFAVAAGAVIVRAHDIAETADAIKLAQALRLADSEPEAMKF